MPVPVLWALVEPAPALRVVAMLVVRGSKG
jgi:hypothetical protein